MVQSYDTVVQIIYYPTNTSAIATGWYSRGGLKPLKERALKTLKVRIAMTKKAIWSNKLVRTYKWNSNFCPYLDENEFDLGEILQERN